MSESETPRTSRTSLESIRVRDPEALRAEIARLEQLQQSNATDWQRLPFAAALLLLAVPVGMLLGVAAAVIFVVFSVCLAVIAVFLIGGRQQQYDDELRDLRRQLASMERR